MASILLMAIGIGIATLLLGSVVFSFLIPSDDVLSPQEKKCQEIANEGYRIHTLYPESSPDELPEKDMKRLLYIDNLWIKDCVNILSAESLFSIINNVERDFSHDE